MFNPKNIFNGPFQASFSYISALSTIDRKCFHYKILPITGYELRTSGTRNDALPTEPQTPPIKNILGPFLSHLRPG